jgi:hypothetical protein
MEVNFYTCRLSSWPQWPFSLLYRLWQPKDTPASISVSAKPCVHLTTLSQIPNGVMTLNDKLDAIWTERNRTCLDGLRQPTAFGVIIEPGASRVRGRNANNSIRIFGVPNQNKFKVSVDPEFRNSQNKLGYTENYIFWDIMPCSRWKSIDVSERHVASIFRVEE